MILYHGTSQFSGHALLRGSPPKLQFYRHIQGDQPAFCTSRSITEAGRFAMRRCTSFDETGLIIVFDASELSGKDYISARDSSIYDEQEVAVLKPAKLKVVGCLEYHQGRWTKVPEIPLVHA